MSIPKTLITIGSLLVTLEASAQRPSLSEAPAIVRAPSAARPHLTTLPAANEYRLSAVQLEDGRPQVSDRTIKLPFMSSPGRGDKVWPALTVEQQTHIKALLQATFRADSSKPAVTLRCRIIDAHQQFMASVTSEMLIAYVLVELELIDADGRLLMASSGSGKRWHQSMDATYKRVDELYKGALEDAIRGGANTLVMPIEE